MSKRLKPSFDYESHIARTNLEKSIELSWRDDASYFWADIVKMKRRALRRKNTNLKEQDSGKSSFT